MLGVIIYSGSRRVEEVNVVRGYFYSPPRTLLANTLTVDYAVTGPSAQAVKLATIDAGASFSVALTLGIATSYPGVSAIVFTTPSSANNSTTTTDANVILAAIILGSVAGAGLLLCIIFVIRSSRSAAVKTTTTAGAAAASKSTRNIHAVPLSSSTDDAPAALLNNPLASIGASSKRSIVSSLPPELTLPSLPLPQKVWVRVANNNSNADEVYYFNDATGETKWPEDMAPEDL